VEKHALRPKNILEENGKIAEQQRNKRLINIKLKNSMLLETC
jgi:hypothetical protein